MSTFTNQTQATNEHLVVLTSVIDAALDYLALKSREEHPHGEFDRQGRWYPAYREDCCAEIRPPSVAYPYSLLLHCRSIKHVAYERALTATAVRKVARQAEKYLAEGSSREAIKERLVQELEDLSPETLASRAVAARDSQVASLLSDHQSRLVLVNVLDPDTVKDTVCERAWSMEDVARMRPRHLRILAEEAVHIPLPVYRFLVEKELLPDIPPYNVHAGVVYAEQCERSQCYIDCWHQMKTAVYFLEAVEYHHEDMLTW